MRRAAPAVIATVIGLGALASFKSSPGTPTKSSAAVHAKKTRTSTGTSAPPPANAASTAPPATSGGPPTTQVPAADRTVDGDPFDNRYGTVQVRVKLRGTRILDVTALQMPFDREQSASISQQAEPLLRQEALQAQSGQIDIIGGATYSSIGYQQSLQSALAKAAR
jgi:uncharacterized protein with FMN-binding domain